MNKTMLIGRLTNDPTVTMAQDMKIARFTLAVDRMGKDKGADFIGCATFGKTAEVVENYCHKGNKIAICGRIQTGSYTNKDGQKVYTTDVVVENLEFCENKRTDAQKTDSQGNDFDDVADECLPFN